MKQIRYYTSLLSTQKNLIQFLSILFWLQLRSTYLPMHFGNIIKSKIVVWSATAYEEMAFLLSAPNRGLYDEWTMPMNFHECSQVYKN